MPHICTRCKNVFDDGVDVLGGCPVCGWKKFLFVKSEAQIEEVKKTLNASEIGGPYEPWPENDDSLRRILEEPSPKSDPKPDRPPRKHELRAKRDLPEPNTDAPKEKLDADGEETVESIRIPEPGTYELNLASLFERDELVMAVKDGTYLIDLSSAFKKWKKS